MPKIPTNPKYREINLSRKIRNWRQNRSGTQVRVGNARHAIDQLTQQINHLEARQPKRHFSQSISQNYCYWGYADPLLEWQSVDYCYNGRNVRFDIIATTMDNEVVEDHYAWKTGWDNSDYQTSPAVLDRWGPPWSHLSFVYSRADMTEAVITDGLGVEAYENFEIWDICVQEEPVDFLDTDDHRFCLPHKSQSNTAVRTTEIEELRERFHEIRSQNLPQVLNWSAQTTTETPTSALNHSWGICSERTTDYNIWDNVNIARTTTSPGSSFFGYNAGIGNENYNRNIHVVCAAKVKCIDGSGDPEGYVTFEGPAHVASNTCELSSTSTTWEWVGGTTSDFLYLYSESAWDDSTIYQNKIDIFGRVTASDKLQIGGVCAWVEYNKD